ncbi:MAG: class I SAM-dependent methyltransferase [Gilvibacter sp.]
MSLQLLRQQIEGVDIYLLDQILKGRYLKEHSILDAGCGAGRNLKWFYQNGMTIFGIDNDPDKIALAKANYASQQANFINGELDNMPYKDVQFDHIICSAVLHFASNTEHFYKMLGEMIRVLKPNGTLFVRLTSTFATSKNFEQTGQGLYNLRDGTERFLLTPELLAVTLESFPLALIEPLKTVNVNDLRCMSTLVLQKQDRKLS